MGCLFRLRTLKGVLIHLWTYGVLVPFMDSYEGVIHLGTHWGTFSICGLLWGCLFRYFFNSYGTLILSPHSYGGAYPICKLLIGPMFHL